MSQRRRRRFLPGEGLPRRGASLRRTLADLALRTLAGRRAFGCAGSRDIRVTAPRGLRPSRPARRRQDRRHRVRDRRERRRPRRGPRRKEPRPAHTARIRRPCRALAGHGGVTHRRPARAAHTASTGLSKPPPASMEKTVFARAVPGTKEREPGGSPGACAGQTHVIDPAVPISDYNRVSGDCG